MQDFQQVLLTTVLDEDFLKQVQAVSKTQRPKLVLQLQADIALLREVIAAGLGQSRNGAVEQWDHLEKSLTEVCSISSRCFVGKC